MEELYNMGISSKTINEMFIMNSFLKDITKEEIIEKKNLLIELNCNKREIVDIISSNSLFLSRTDSEINNLISFLKNKGFKCLNLLLSSNPLIFNLEVFEIDDYINLRVNNGELLENIVDDLEANPYKFCELY